MTKVIGLSAVLLTGLTAPVRVNPYDDCIPEHMSTAQNEAARRDFCARSPRKFNRLRRNSLLKRTGNFQIDCREDFSTNREVTARPDLISGRDTPMGSCPLQCRKDITPQSAGL
jgi:hypothetical protein